MYLAEYFDLHEVAKFWEGVVNINNWHQKRITEIVVKKLFGTITGKKIIVLGFAFKANTNDTRESAAIKICKDLINEGANLVIQDPKVKPKQIEKDLQIKQMSEEHNEGKKTLNNQIGKWQFSKSLDIFDDAHASLVLTEWEEYKKINWHKAAKKMVKPSWVFDSRSIINAKEVKESGIKLWRVGDGS